MGSARLSHPAASWQSWDLSSGLNLNSFTQVALKVAEPLCARARQPSPFFTAALGHMGKLRPLLFTQGHRPGRASLVAQVVKNLPLIRETQLGSLGWEDPLEKGTVTHSTTLAWRTPWTEKPGRLQSVGSQRLAPDQATLILTSPSQTS